MNYKKDRYYAVVETGSCSMDRKRWEERATCGHAHKTIAAAVKCLDKKRRYYCVHGHVAGTLCKRCLGGIARSDCTSALWYNGTIHNQDQEPISYYR